MITTILIFIVVLGLLVFVHEFGHFIVAKKSGMAVEEFGFGFPPRLVGLQKVNGKWKVLGASNKAIDPDVTVYSINWIPLGGFVRIRGENNEHENDPKSFINKGFWPRFFTLVAGVVMNVLLAFVIFSAGYMIGLPVAVDSAQNIPAHSTFTNPEVAILTTQPGKPAEQAGLRSNDIITAIDGQKITTVPEVQNYIRSHQGQEIKFEIKRGKQNITIPVTPQTNVKEGEGPVGIQLSIVGKLSYSPFYAIVEGVKTTGMQTAVLFSGLYQLVSGQLGVDNLGGPVKIAQYTGQVAGLGLIYLMNFTAFLSLNLAVLNILPFPALDGGRVLFLIIEKIRGKKNNQRIEQYVNAAGFIFLILLMVFVTINDIVRK